MGINPLFAVYALAVLLIAAVAFKIVHMQEEETSKFNRFLKDMQEAGLDDLIDYTAEPCKCCGQVDIGQQGVKPCPTCGLPTRWMQVHVSLHRTQERRKDVRKI